MPFITDTIVRSDNDLKNLEEAIIQKEYTAIHSSFYWKFKREAKNYIDSISNTKDYIFKEINSLADYSELKNSKEKEDIEKHETIQVSDYVHVKARLFAKHYPLGILHLLPVFLQIAAIILFGYSLWTYIGFNEIQSTAVVLGVMVGLIVTGGFVQVIGRQATFYWNYEDYQMAKETIFYLIRKGGKSLLFVIFVISFFNIFFHLFPFNVLLVISYIPASDIKAVIRMCRRSYSKIFLIFPIGRIMTGVESGFGKIGNFIMFKAVIF